MRPELVVVIATAGRAELLERTLKSLAACRLPAEYRQTIVVENGPSHDAAQIVRQSGPKLKIRYLHQPQANKSAALNCALNQLSDCLVFFTDDDVRIGRETLCQYLDAASRSQSAAFFGGPIDVDYECAPPDWLQDFLPCCARGWSLRQSVGEIRRPVFLGCNWAAYSCDLRAMGGFDPEKGPGPATISTGQETDMQQRLLDSGLRGLYVPSAKVWHYVAAARCTPEWTLERTFRGGIYSGVQSERGRKRVLGYPLRDMLKMCQVLMCYGVTRFSRNPRRQFFGRYKLSWLAGYARGLLTASETQPESQLRKAA